MTGRVPVAGYSVDQQVGFVAGWFSEWSALQRRDFAPVLAAQLAEERLAAAPTATAGLLNGISDDLQRLRLHRPPSIYQCQVRLFCEWSHRWPMQLRRQLCRQLVAIDAQFETSLARAEEGAGEAHLSASTSVSAGPTTATRMAQWQRQSDRGAEGTPEPLSIVTASDDSQLSELTPTELY